MSINKLIRICEQKENKAHFLSERKHVYHYEDSNGAIKSEPYIETIKVNIQNDLNNAKKRLVEIQGAIHSLIKRRDKVFAHNDAKYYLNIDDLQTDAPLKYCDIEELLSFASQLCNTLLINTTDTSFFTQSQDINDIMNILNKLHEIK